MATINNKYGGSGCTITITLTSLVNNGARSSASVDNTVDLYLDALVTLKIASGSTGTGATGYVNIYAYGTTGCALYTDTATGADENLTPASPINMRPLGWANVVANSTRYVVGPFSVAQAFGGALPSKWGVMVENKSASNLSSTAASHLVTYQGVYGQTI